jgi:hypothetical protein
MTPRSEQFCGNCAAFFRNRVNLTSPQIGDCRRGRPAALMVVQQIPPTIQAPQGQVAQQLVGVWPPTQANNSCLEWLAEEGDDVKQMAGTTETRPLTEPVAGG